MIKEITLVSILVLFSSLLVGCSHGLEDYKQGNPKLDLQQFFNGTLKVKGIVQDYSGLVTRRFDADIKAAWQGNLGILDETFYFNNGEISHRCWRLTKDGDKYSGTAGDVVGVAKGRTSGNALNWEYQLVVPIDGSEYTITLDDWLFLLDEDYLINKTEMRYWGVTVGEITLFIEKQSKQKVELTKPECTFAAG